jgi:hypothetical protein
VRALTKIVDVDEDTDTLFLHAAQAGTAGDMERLYRHYQLLKDQDTPPPPSHLSDDRVGVRTDCGVPVCRHHHRLVHEGNWTVGYDPTTRAAVFNSPTEHQVIAGTPGALKLVA